MEVNSTKFEINAESWKTKKIRQSVIDKINSELKCYRLTNPEPGKKIERAICEKAKSKLQYLGYVAKIILNIRHMVCIQDSWLENHVKEVLSKPPPKLRKVLSTRELAEYNIKMMELNTKIDNQTKLVKKKHA